MAGEWRETTAAGVAVPERGTVSGPFGSTISKRFFVDRGVPVIRGNNLSLGTDGPRFHDDDFVFLSNQKADELSSAECKAGDLVFTARGTIGQVGLIPSNAHYSRYILSANQLRLRPDPEQADALYLYYWFSSPEMVALMQSRNAGSALPNMNLGSLRGLPVMLPPLPKQRAIAHILGMLDDKIELNRRMSETLEAMARALFKSWFVDFGPVRARAEGRDPGLPQPLADLFPARLVDSELGEIPDGWEVRPIGEAVRVAGGGTPSTKQPRYWEGGKHCFCTPKDMSSLTSPVLLVTERHLTDAGLTKVSSGLLPAGTVVLSSRAPIGYLAITEVPVSVNQGIIAMVCDRLLPNVYVLQWAWTNMDVIEANANGSTFQEISKKNFRPIPVIIPSDQVLDCFTAIAQPFYEGVVVSIRESCTLAALRDTLLPKLISGELRVKDAERLVVEVR